MVRITEREIIAMRAKAAEAQSPDAEIELRRVLALTEPYLCEMPAEVEAEVRKALQVPR